VIRQKIFYLSVCSVFALFNTSFLKANTIIVDNTGTTPGSFLTIKDAVDASSTGTIILLAAGQTFTGANNSGIEISINLTFDTTDTTLPMPIIDLSGTNADLFTIDSGITVTMGNLFIANGSGSATGEAGAVYNSGILYAYSCTFSNNSSSNSSVHPGFGVGGAIYNDSILTITSCTFISNSVTNRGYGGAISNSGTLTVFSCTFSGNTTNNGRGGAIGNEGTLDSATDCTFSGNSAADGIGGAIYNIGIIDSVTSCIFSSNNAAEGGAIDNHGPLQAVDNCTFNNNNATEGPGGAIINWVTIDSVAGCTFSGNSATVDIGGAISNLGSITVENNCTFNNNNATSGGAVACDDSFTVILPSRSTVITSCSLTDNSATNSGGGIYVHLTLDSSTAYFSCNRIVNNTATSAGSEIYVTDDTVITVTAQNNWWGTNNPNPSLLFYDSNNRINWQPFMKVALNVNPPSPLPGQNTTINADFTKNSDGDTIAGCHIPDGTPVNFSSNQGLIAPTSASTVNGLAPTTLTPNNQSAQVCALVGPGQENFLDCSMTNPGFNRVNWGCLCGEGGYNGVFIGAYVDPAGIANRLMGWTFDGTSCAFITELNYTTTAIINHVVFNATGTISIGILAQQSDNSYRVDLATFDGVQFTPKGSHLFSPGVTASKLQFILDSAGNLYAAVDTRGQINVMSIDKSSLSFINTFTQDNLNSATQSNFLYWYANNNGLYLVQGYNNAGVPTVATYKVTLDPNATVIETGIETDIGTEFTKSFCCSTCQDYLVLGGTSIPFGGQAALVPCTLSTTGSLIPGIAVPVSGTAVYYTERCCCDDDHLLVATDNGLFSYANDLSMVISSTLIQCINTCWCCKGDNHYCAAVTTGHEGEVFKENGASLEELCTLVP